MLPRSQIIPSHTGRTHTQGHAEQVRLIQNKVVGFKKKFFLYFVKYEPHKDKVFAMITWI